MQPTAFDKAKELFAIERVVAFIITPGLLIVSPWFVKLMATWYPGVHLTTAEVSHVIVVVLAGIVLTAIMWLHGRQNPPLVHSLESALAAVRANPSAGPDLLARLLPHVDSSGRVVTLLEGAGNIAGTVGSDLPPAAGLGTQVPSATPPEAGLPPAGDGPPSEVAESVAAPDQVGLDMKVPPAGDFAEPAAVVGSPGLAPPGPPT